MTIDLSKPIRLKNSREPRKYGGEVFGLHVILTDNDTFANIGPVTMEYIEAEYENVPEEAAKPEPVEPSASVTLNRRIARCCDTEMSRYALGCVQVLSDGNGGAYAVATDGKQLTVVKTDGDVRGKHLVPHKLAMADKPTTVRLENGRWVTSDGRFDYTVEGRFPKVPDVFRDELGEHYRAYKFDPRLLVRAGRAIQGNGNGVTLLLGKADEIALMVGDDGIAAVMPLVPDGSHDGDCDVARRAEYAERVKAFKDAYNKEPQA